MICIKCQHDKPVENYYKVKTHKGKYEYYRKECSECFSSKFRKENKLDWFEEKFSPVVRADIKKMLEEKVKKVEISKKYNIDYCLLQYYCRRGYFNF